MDHFQQHDKNQRITYARYIALNIDSYTFMTEYLELQGKEHKGFTKPVL